MAVEYVVEPENSHSKIPNTSQSRDVTENTGNQEIANIADTNLKQSLIYTMKSQHLILTSCVLILAAMLILSAPFYLPAVLLFIAEQSSPELSKGLAFISMFSLLSLYVLMYESLKKGIRINRYRDWISS